MVRYGREIERPLNLRLDGLLTVLVGQKYGLTLRVRVRVPRVVTLARDIGVERIPRMDVEVAEHRLTQRIVSRARLALLGALERGRLGRCG